MTAVSGVTSATRHVSEDNRLGGGLHNHLVTQALSDTGRMIISPGSVAETSVLLAAVRSQILDAIESGRRIVRRDLIDWAVLDVSVHPLADGTVAVAHRVVARIVPADGETLSTLTAAVSRLCDLLSERPSDPEADPTAPEAPRSPSAAAPRQARSVKQTLPVPRAAT